MSTCGAGQTVNRDVRCAEQTTDQEIDERLERDCAVLFHELVVDKIHVLVLVTRIQLMRGSNAVVDPHGIYNAQTGQSSGHFGLIQIVGFILVEVTESALKLF